MNKMNRVLTRWISRIDNNKSSRHTVLTGLLQWPLQLKKVQAPIVVLVQVIWNLS